MNTKKCEFCGAFLPAKPFYSLERYVGTLEIYVCPNCKQRIQKWIPKVVTESFMDDLMDITELLS